MLDADHIYAIELHKYRSNNVAIEMGVEKKLPFEQSFYLKSTY
jgi:hypothetical protein